MATIENPRPTNRVRVACALLCLPLLLACQSYEANPLAPGDHLARWQERSPESVHEFLAELREQEGAPPVDFDAHDGLTLAEARLVALAFQPRLRVARMELGRARASADQAGYAPDPNRHATYRASIRAARSARRNVTRPTCSRCRTRAS